MALMDTFSRRKRRANGGGGDVYRYDALSEKLRVQISQIFTEAMGDFRASSYNFEAKDSYKYLVETMRKEKGVFKLVKYADNEQVEFLSWFLSETNIDDLLDGVELALRIIDRHYRDNIQEARQFVRSSPDYAISEFNDRCLEDGFGFQYVDGSLIEINSTYLHSETVVAAFNLTNVKEFSSVNSEYHFAHKLYREGDFGTCITECAKAFESTLKIIGKAKNWPITDSDNAAKLLEAAYKEEFIPKFMQTEFGALRAVLESGVPTIRNKMSAHGAGSTTRNVPKHLAAFQLHQSAAAIVFLIDNYRAST